MLKKLLIALVICVVALLAVGFLISGEYDVKRTITINASPEDIYPHVTTLKQWPKWTVWNTDKYPDMKIEYAGERSGVGAMYSWTGETSGDGNMEITTADEFDKVEWTLAFEGFDPSQGFCTMTMVENNMTRVEFGMKGSMGSNPLMKLMSLSMDSMMGSEFDQCLTGLKKLVESGEEIPEDTKDDSGDDSESPSTTDKPGSEETDSDAADSEDADSEEKTTADADKEAAAAK